MAMNKIEQAELLFWKKRASLNMPQYPKPKRVSVEVIRAYVEKNKELWVGWHMNSYSGMVSQGCSNGTYHARDNIKTTTTQGCGEFFATQLEAYQAMRWEKTEKVIEDLFKTDSRIETVIHNQAVQESMLKEYPVS